MAFSRFGVSEASCSVQVSGIGREEHRTEKSGRAFRPRATLGEYPVDLIAFSYSLLHFDPHLGSGRRCLNMGVLDLHGRNLLLEVRRVSSEMQRVSERDGSAQLDDSDLRPSEVVSDRPSSSDIAALRSVGT